MARPHSNVVEFVAPAFQALLAELAGTVEVNPRVAQAYRGEAFPGPRSGLARHVQRVLAKSDEGSQVVQPRPEVCWYAGEAACQVGQEWSSGLLFLFAAGHFRRYGLVLASLNESVVPNHRKAAWIAAMRTACDPSLLRDSKQYSAELEAQGVSAPSVRRAVKDFVARGCVLDRPDRRTVTLSPEERAALRDAFAGNSKESPRALEVLLATCEFAETANGGIAVQRDIAATPLWHFFTTNGAGW